MFLVAAVVLVSVMWWATAGALDRQLVAAIRADAVALTERWREGGQLALQDAIQERIALDISNETIYLLLSESGERLAGNMEAWPDEANSDESFLRIRIMHDGIPTDARLLRRDLPGMRMLVGRDESERLQLRLTLTEGVAWSLGASLIVALLGASIIRRIIDRRLEPTFRTALGIAGGDLTRRVPLTGQGDEFDRLGESMNTMLDRIESLMQGVKGVSDAIAHDLRTPIARARAKLEESLIAARDADDLRAAMEQGIQDLDGISRIFQALLRITEVEAGARRAAFAPFDLVETLRDVADFYDAAAEMREQRLETDLPDTLPMVGDRDLMMQATANLLDNAVKFTPPGGVLRLSARREEDGVLEVIVSDSGPGLSLQDRARAGVRFFRAEPSRATPGYGLGLSLVRAVAQLHGGVVRLEDAIPGASPPGLSVRIIVRSGN
ncbi:HAMP domain-containing protein [Rhodovarius crocodyli]|uniref:histidine kinase n=2 Tax=Rhodovarius crocodyli TaxID=1979269 RepID=A0A437MPR7_9PROT|nr:HAMP domain-containing protein [Rhodovarius crocodyli]